jgi:hypothetical protein
VFLPKPSKSIERLNVEDRKMGIGNLIGPHFMFPFSNVWSLFKLHQAKKENLSN